MDLTKINDILAEAYQDCEYPVCLHQTREWGRTRPFEGLTVLDATPIFRNTLAKHRALIAAGARLIVGRSAMLPGSDDIVALLRESGIKVVDSGEEQSETVDVVLDCGAAFIHWRPRLGFVELTRTGVPRYAGSQKPVFVADGGRIKKIETCLGTGESFFRAMRQLGYADWKGKKLVIFGSGKVGSGLLAYAKAYGAVPVVVTKPESVTPSVADKAAAVLDCDDVAAVVEAVADAYAVVTATGVAHALSHPALTDALAKSPALLANMGVEDEFGPAMPASRVLCGKRALNFILEEPTHMKYIDATMGLHNEGINYLLSHPRQSGLIDPPAQMEEYLLGITRNNGCLGNEINEI